MHNKVNANPIIWIMIAAFFIVSLIQLLDALQQAQTGRAVVAGLSLMIWALFLVGLAVTRWRQAKAERSLPKSGK